MENIKLKTIKRSTLDVNEIGTYLNISSEKIYLMVRERSIPHFRIGSRILFKLEAIDKWIDNMVAESIDESE